MQMSGVSEPSMGTRPSLHSLRSSWEVVPSQSLHHQPADTWTSAQSDSEAESTGPYASPLAAFANESPDKIATPDSSSINSEITLRADRLRNDLCITRIHVDSERDKLDSTFSFTQDSLEEMISFLAINPSFAAAPIATAQEFQRLQHQTELARNAMSAQARATRDAEAELRKLEVEIANLGVWYVHLPDASI